MAGPAGPADLGGFWGKQGPGAELTSHRSGGPTRQHTY